MIASRLLRARRAGHRPADDGVIAIIVALSLSTFLLGFAALAVDLGSAYTRKAELQSIADQLAVSGAAGLPDITHPGGAIDLMTQTLTKLCDEDKTPGLCPAAGTPNLNWATDHDPANGEISFITDPDGDAKFNLANTVQNLATPSSALEVVLPPSTVQFGLAGAFGFSTATLHQRAAARVGTPLGLGILPFALTDQDLAAGQFCVNAKPNRKYPTKLGGISLTQGVVPGGVPANREFPIDMSLHIDDGANQLMDVAFSMENSPADLIATRNGLTWHVTLPAGAPGSHIPIWATGTEVIDGHPYPFVTNLSLINYAGVLAPSDDLCQQPLATTRGFVKLARAGAGAGDLDTLSANIRSGPKVNLYPSNGLMGTIGPLLNCVSEVFNPASTCLASVVGTPFSADLTDGLLQSGGGDSGRLIGNCGQGTITAHAVSGIDASTLFDSTHGLLDINGHGSSALLLKRLSATPGFSPVAGPGDRGWITSKVLHCPRLAVMPVIGADPLPGFTGNAITSFRYVWIDDTTSPNRGLNGTQSPVTSFRGYAIDPGFLPTEVAGSPLVGPFLGTDMPKEALLISDLGGS